MAHLSKVLSAIALVCIINGVCLSQNTLSLDLDHISKTINNTPKHGTTKASHQFGMISLPMPDGTEVDFVVKHAPLADSTSPIYNGTSSNIYRLHAPDIAGYNGSMIVYEDGIHATLNTPSGLLEIKKTPSSLTNGQHSYLYYKDVEPFIHNANDAIRPDGDRIKNLQSHEHSDGSHHVSDRRLKANNNFFEIGGGNTRKVVDLFILSEQSFVNQYNGNETLATDRVIEIVNGVRAIWEQDFNVTLNYMGVFFHPNTLGTDEAQTAWNAASDTDVSGGTKADVDLAHFFVGNGGGGAASLFIACTDNKFNGFSASGNVGNLSYVSLVAHEMAHQMGVDHTWTGNDENCTADQFGWSTGVEPGAGVTLAGYDGICGNDNIPNVGNGSFHHMETAREVAIYTETGLGKSPFSSIISVPGQIPAYANNYGNPTCLNTIAYSNNAPQVNANPYGLNNLNIPARTPFELNGSASDADGDQLTYQWDQMDFALTQAPLDGYATREDGPLFRSYFPGNESSRSFPKLDDILQDQQIKGEILPQTTRIMRFGLMVRDGNGGVGMDTIGFNVIDGGTGFAVTEAIDVSSPSAVSLTWNTANTTQSPISCNNVSILYSIDGGQTFPHTVLASTPNDGSESIDLAQFGITSSGRIKIKCATSVFFDINNQDLNISPGNCSAQSSQICNPLTITADPGDASLNLDPNGHLIINQTSSSFILSAPNTNGTSITDNNGSCDESFFDEYPVTMEFTVSQSGSYDISADDGSTIAVLEKGNYVYNSNNPCSNSGTFLGANFTSAGSPQTLNVQLEQCNIYTILVTALSANDDVSVTISGAANAISTANIASGTAYTYIAVDNQDDTIDEISSNADFTTLSAGTYKVYGVSYESSINTNSWLGTTQTQSFSATVCAMKSSNFHSLNISGQPCSASNTTTTILPSDIIANSIFRDGNLISGGTGSNKVLIDVNNVTFNAEQSIEIIPEFEVEVPNTFTAEIVPCDED